MFTPSKAFGSSGDDEQMDLPPGFRFHPTDEELITHYLSPKVLDNNFCAIAIGEVDLNKAEPWDLPWMAKMGEKEWYFFCMKDRKYPTGFRTNRATKSGYWKATGKDKEIFKVKKLVGMKKTLVFYKGRAPRGEKTNWVMHEFRLEGNSSMHNVSKPARNEWVICRIFKKSSGGKKVHISGLNRTPNNHGDDFPYSNLPPLLDISFCEDQTRTSKTANTSHVTCFSKQVDDDHITTFNDSQSFSVFDGFNQMDSALMQDHSILKILLDNYNVGNVKTEFSHDTGMSTDMSSSPMSMTNHEVGLKPCEDQYFSMSSSARPDDIGCLWDY